MSPYDTICFALELSLKISKYKGGDSGYFNKNHRWKLLMLTVMYHRKSPR